MFIIDKTGRPVRRLPGTPMISFEVVPYFFFQWNYAGTFVVLGKSIGTMNLLCAS